MEIFISIKDPEVLLERNKISLQPGIRKAFMGVLIFIAFGILMLIYSQASLKRETSGLNVTSAFGFTFIFSSIIMIRFIYSYKKQNKKSLENYLYRYKNQSPLVEIKITDKSISIESYDGIVEYKWNGLRYYKFYKGYLFLIDHVSYYPSVVLNKDQMTPEEFQALTNYVTGKLYHKN